MTEADRKDQTQIHIGIACGLVAGVLYPVAMLDLLPQPWSNMAFMLFGPFLAASAPGMHAFYRRGGDAASNDLAHLLLVLAAAAFTFMATMQMSIWTLVPHYMREAPETDATIWRAVLRGTSTTQLGLDYAFDIFVSAAAALIGWRMVRHPRVPTLLGLAGIAVGLGGVVLNTLTFPENAGDAGLIDPGPFFGVWFSLAWFPLVLLRNWRPQPA
jgi:hypothetical protein